MNAAHIPRWWVCCGALPEIQPPVPSRHFSFYGLQRNAVQDARAADNWNPGIHGIRDDWLLEHYKQVLDSAYAKMLTAGWPGAFDTDHSGRIPVFLFAVDDPAAECRTPKMEELFFKGKYVPVLALPSRFYHSTETAAKKHASSCAVHELSHALGTSSLAYRRDITHHSQRPPGDWALFRSWLWFDEGRSVAAEQRFLPGNDSWKACGLDWVDRPERALDLLEARYQAAFFVRYLDAFMQSRGQPNFTSLIWRKSSTIWDSARNHNVTPLTALGAIAVALHEHSEVFASPEEVDVFASNYCMDSYFHCLPTRSDDPLAFVTYKERAIARTWNLSHVDPKNPQHISETTSLPQFACRYFRFNPQARAGRLTARVETDPGADLKIELALVRNNTLKRVPQPPATRSDGRGKLVLAIQSDQALTKELFDHAVLVVSHCPNLLSTKTPHKQIIEFTLHCSCT